MYVIAERRHLRARRRAAAGDPGGESHRRADRPQHRRGRRARRRGDRPARRRGHARPAGRRPHRRRGRLPGARCAAAAERGRASGRAGDPRRHAGPARDRLRLRPGPAAGARSRPAGPTFDVERFVEKPTAEQAAELHRHRPGAAGTRASSPGRGPRSATGSTRHAPDIVGPIAGHLREPATAGATCDAAYPSIRATSIDYAVMEPASLEGAVAVVPMTSAGATSAAGRRCATPGATRRGGSAAGVRRARAIAATSARPDSLVLAGDRLVVTIGLRRRDRRRHARTRCSSARPTGRRTSGRSPRRSPARGVRRAQEEKP